jgi:hypothetical protein
MARNGSGTYNLPAGNPVVTGTTISSTTTNNTFSDIATALTGSISKDGQTTPTSNLPMGGYAHTGVADATVRTQYASVGQVQDGTPQYLTSVAGTNVITATGALGLSAYVTGQTFRFVAAGASTGAVTLNINAIGAKSLVKTDGSALVSGDIASGAAVQVMYDGTNFQLLSDANGASETVTTLTATTKVVTPQVGSSSGAFTIQSANTTAVTVDASQNVGIGTASPTQKLQVYTSAATGGQIQITNSATGATSTDGVLIGYDGSNDVIINNQENTQLKLYTSGILAASINSSGALSFNSGYGSVATAYGCRAWVNFNGTGTVAIRASGNVSSITDNGTGNYTLNFTTAMPDANYAFKGSGIQSGVGNGPTIAIANGATPSTTALNIISVNDAGSTQDISIIGCSIHR